MSDHCSLVSAHTVVPVVETVRGFMLTVAVSVTVLSTSTSAMLELLLNTPTTAAAAVV
jgi:hypothetical protein